MNKATRIKAVENRLYRYPYMNETIEKLNSEKELYLSLKYDTKITTSFSSDGGSGSGISDKTCDQVIKITELYDKKISSITERIDSIIADQAEIESWLDGLSQNERMIIQCRYFYNMQWHSIASETRFSIRRCQDFRRAAIELLGEIS